MGSARLRTAWSLRRHYLSSCALLHASTGDETILAKGNTLVAILAECQAKDGYLGAYPATFYDKLRAHQRVWAPFYTYHKILAGMIDMHEHTGNKQALEVALKMADWADTYSKSFAADDWQRVLLTEHGGMNEASFNLYAITGTTNTKTWPTDSSTRKYSIPSQPIRTCSRATTPTPTSPK